MHGRRMGWLVLATLTALLLARSTAVRAQAGDPGPPPPADWGTAQPVEWDAFVPSTQSSIE